MFRIMVVEDDRSIRRLFEVILKKEGYSVLTAENGVDALAVLDREHIDLIVLDIMMPDMDGYTLARELRESGNTVPILMATAKVLPLDKKQGFDAGVDDYMTKPVDTDEMLWRIKALLRRSQAVSSRKLSMGGVTLDYDALTMTRDGQTQTLPQKEFMLLYKLLSNPNHIFTRIQLMDEIWGMESESGDTTVNVHINRLRRRCEACTEFELVAVRGLGYKAVTHV